MTQKASSTSRNHFQYRNRQVFVPAEHLAVGVIVNVHGLRGEVRVELHTDFPERYAPGVVLLMGEELKPMVIRSARPHKNQMLVQFEDVASREAAEALRGQWLFVHQDDAAQLDEDTYWIHELIGLTVQTEEGELLGRLDDVLETGANDVYIIKPARDLGIRELLLPAIAEVILDVDIEKGVMTVALPPGLLETT